jgi:hypothetical protein
MSMSAADSEYIYSSEWIHRLEQMRHWEYYWHQQKLMEDLLEPGDNILEIGVGSGFAANYLRSKEFCVTTFDIDADKHPDIVGNVVEHQFDQRFDCLMAFEILEHIPYGEFESVMKTIPQYVGRYAFISLPRNLVSILSGQIKLPRLRPLSWNFRVRRRKIVTENHHWELDYGPYNTGRVEQFFARCGFDVVRRLSHGNINFYALKIGHDGRAAE